MQITFQARFSTFAVSPVTPITAAMYIFAVSACVCAAYGISSEERERVRQN